MTSVFRPSGILDAAAAERLLDAAPADLSCIFDFSDVESVHFAALRRLMNARRAGRKFSIVNACDAVVERFTDSGVGTFIDVSRKPKPLDMSQYEEFGASFMSKSYNSFDGDAMIKVYGANASRELVVQEKATARAVMLFGIPTPLVGTLYEDGEKKALDFERIPGKRSLSRIMAEEPERTEEITRCFARMCRQLHATPCDPAIFRDRVQVHRQSVERCTAFTDQEKAPVLAFIDRIPAVTTCLHGDLQPSNVIRTPEGEDLWIDLGDFGYGHPLLDVAMLYFLTRLIDEGRAQHLFHMGLDELGRMWDIFADEYAEARSAEAKQAFEREVLPFAVLHMIYLGTEMGFVPGMTDQIRSMLGVF